MREANVTWFKELLEDRQGPCVSIYMPVHRSGPPAREDPVRFNSVVCQAHELLAKRWPARLARRMVDKIQLASDQVSPQGGARDGIALFAAPDYFNVIQLQGPVEQSVFVTDSFYVK